VQFAVLTQMRHSRKLVFLLSLAVALLCLAPRLGIAQDLDNVTITGRVADQNGAVIPGASVTATLVKTKVERSVVADGDGRYKIIQHLAGFADRFQRSFQHRPRWRGSKPR
jgi:hypothetical protein